MRAMTAAALAMMAWLGGWAPGAHAATTYAIDQRFGDIDFSVSHLGLFHSQGSFRRFTGQLTIDEAAPRQTRINVVIDTRSVEMGWSDGAAMLRSPPYFDVAQYPNARFTSTRVLPEGAGRYEIDGALQLRGTTQPVVLHAALRNRHKGAAGDEVADFVVTGVLRRSAFGMTADRTFISDKVHLRIDARVRLAASAANDVAAGTHE